VASGQTARWPERHLNAFNVSCEWFKFVSNPDSDLLGRRFPDEMCNKDFARLCPRISAGFIPSRWRKVAMLVMSGLFRICSIVAERVRMPASECCGIVVNTIATRARRGVLFHIYTVICLPVWIPVVYNRRNRAVVRCSYRLNRITEWPGNSMIVA
jgi:hypothetical protein